MQLELLEGRDVQGLHGCRVDGGGGSRRNDDLGGLLQFVDSDVESQCLPEQLQPGGIAQDLRPDLDWHIHAEQ